MDRARPFGENVGGFLGYRLGGDRRVFLRGICVKWGEGGVSRKAATRRGSNLINAG